MTYRVLADIVVVVHLLWILFLVAGVYWGVKRRLVMMIHGSGLVFAMVSTVFGWYCPLTHLEFWLMEKAQPSPASHGSFIAHYAKKLIYIDVPAFAIFVLTLVLIAFNGWLYWRAFRKKGAQCQ
jgi:hypothetical protein